MRKHLLLITIGPVQEFIAQARRTRDLWFGSHLLSELARAGAAAIAGSGGDLIFPAFQAGDRELKPCSGMLRHDGDGKKPPLNVPNKLLAEIPEGKDPAEIAETAQESIEGRWQAFADEVRQRYSSLLAEGMEEIWEEQIDTFLEFYAAWTPISEEGYPEARERLEKAVASRKNLRDFTQWEHVREGAPKSSLDGGRYSVLPPSKERRSKDFARFRISEGEQLDAVGLVKRTGGEPEQFVPIANVAMAAWLAKARETAEDKLERLGEALEKKFGFRIHRRDLEWTKAFEHDAGALFLPRLVNMFEEAELGGERNAKDFHKRYVAPLLKKMSDPFPYVACLVADGDRMGEILGGMKSPDEHRSFSRKLSGFAGSVRETVEKKHKGLLVYAGGDDVLAFLSLPEALGCAEALARAFREQMAGFGPPERQPTLSVGVGVGHILQGMGELLELGREAERLAKGSHLPRKQEQRNALAVITDKRSGGKASWRARWDGKVSPAERLRDDIALLEGRLSRKKIYEVKSILDRFPRPDEAAQRDEEWRNALRGELKRALGRSHLSGEGGGVTPEEAGMEIGKEDEKQYAEVWAKAYEWVNRMVIAHSFAQAEPKERTPNHRRANHA